MEPEYESELDPPSGRRGWYLAFFGVIAVLALVIAGIALTSQDDGPEEAAIETPQAYAKPDDGLDSIGLPITVTPAMELTDGMTVDVVATGFEPNESVGVVQCTTVSSTLGQGGCDMTTLRSGQVVDASGTLRTTVRVQQILDVGGVAIDCATGNIDPTTWSSGQEVGEGQFGCIIGVGALANYDRSGNAVIAYEGAVFGGPPPSLPTITTLPPGSDPRCPEGPQSTDLCSPAPTTTSSILHQPSTTVTTIAPPTSTSTSTPSTSSTSSSSAPY